MKHLPFLITCLLSLKVLALDHPGMVSAGDDGLRIIADGRPAVAIAVDPASGPAVRIAAANLAKDFERVCGVAAESVRGEAGVRALPTVSVRVVPDGRREAYVLTVAQDGITIVGSDRRGAVYGIYELSEQIGVSPWYDWADAPVARRQNLVLTCGTYVGQEPAVRYRGIFLNDEAPCLTGWVKNTYGTNHGDHRFYARVGELILRLRGNFLWPAMWCWSFYADDPENSRTMDEMGVVMGTSHHEPMARNHQEWARKRKDFGAWNYETNRATLDRFFAEGVARCRGTEDLVTIGMRGDGDEAMGADTNIALVKRIMANQRAIIKRETGKAAQDVPQVWALYKEVLDYYDAGLRPPDDVTILLCDDNWGNVRRLPKAEERARSGGWGLYYHVDYVGAPRNSKWLNVTSAASMWEQLSLAYEYGVDRLWVLNVGDLKPMEYPIQLFLDMARDPKKFTARNLQRHMEDFCAGRSDDLAASARESASVLSRSYRFAARCTPEMLDRNTYNLASGEWQQVRDDYVALAEEARALEKKVPAEAKDWYHQIVLFHVEAMANLYEMYYAAAIGDRARTEAAFARDAELCRAYNEEIAGGKWNGMMRQKHIGYTNWSDNFAADTCPDVADDSKAKEAHGVSRAGQVVFEADDYASATVDPSQRWEFIPGLGRTKGAMEVFPRVGDPKDARLVYRCTVPAGVTQATVRVVVRSTLAFARKEGHRYRVNGQEVNFNARLNEAKENIYSVFYPTVARRVVANEVKVKVPGVTSRRGADKNGLDIILEPLDPGVAFERVIVDWSGAPIRGYLNGDRPKYAPPAKPKADPGALDRPEPYITSVERTQSYDRNMGENWWRRRHAAILREIAGGGSDAPRTYDLVLAGDSITQRWERHGKDAYVAVTNELKVLNLGFGADGVRNLLWRLRSGELDGYRAKAVQLMIGTNNGCAPEETAAEIRACLREIRKRQPQAKILLCAILARGNPDCVERGRNDTVNDLIRPLADGKTILWKDWSPLFTLPDGRMNPKLTDDGLHPNAEGYAVWRDVLLPYWNREIRRE